MNISQIVKSNAYRPNSLTGLDVKSKLREFFMQYVTPFPEFPLISGHHYDVITIPVIIADSYDFFHIMVYG